VDKEWSVAHIISSIENGERWRGERTTHSVFRCVAMESASRQRSPCPLSLGDLASGTIGLRRPRAGVNACLVRWRGRSESGEALGDARTLCKTPFSICCIYAWTDESICSKNNGGEDCMGDSARGLRCDKQVCKGFPSPIQYANNICNQIRNDPVLPNPEFSGEGMQYAQAPCKVWYVFVISSCGPQNELSIFHVSGCAHEYNSNSGQLSGWESLRRRQLLRQRGMQGN